MSDRPRDGTAADDTQAELTAQQLAELYEEHDRSASSAQRAAARVTELISRPSTVMLITGLVVAWMIGNYVARLFGSHALEEFPFPDLAFVATLAAFLVALLILTTQRHDGALAEKRAKLTLQLAVVSERKIAKLIQLVEEQRRDNPLIRDRDDEEAAEMTQSSDPASQLQEIERHDG